MSGDDVLARRFVVSGRVQGVAFRYFTQRRATELGLGGWVRNRPDGTVELVAEGRAAAMEELRRALREGPRLARVERVVENPAPSGQDNVFRIAG